MSEISRTRPTSSLEDWQSSTSGEYPHVGQGLNSGFNVRDLTERLRAQKARSGNGLPPAVGLRANLGAKAGNASGFEGVRHVR